MIYGQPITLCGGKSPFPKYTYSGLHGIIDDGDGNWRIKFFSSGVFTPLEDMVVDIFLVGGGGGGIAFYTAATSGAGGGFTTTEKSITLTAGTPVTVVIGAGGKALGHASSGNRGGTTSFGSHTAAGGYGPTSSANAAGTGGNGGSGGGSGGGNGGSDGSNGTGTKPGTGQGSTTREFGESAGDLYSGGGAGYNGQPGEGGGGTAPKGAYGNGGDGEPFTGGGAGAGHNSSGKGYFGGSGGCGIAIIRNARAA